LDALYAKRGQITMPMTHGFGAIENKLTGRSTHYIQRFRAVLLDIVRFCAEVGDCVPLSRPQFDPKSGLTRERIREKHG
jgi:hypothetical protein